MNYPVKYRSPWGTYLLAMVTLGVYYFVWYVKVNKEITAMSGTAKVGAVGLVLSQCVWPFNWISLANTSGRLTALQAKHNLPPTTTAGMMILSNWWFGSNVRYTQRRLNATYRAIGVPESVVQTETVVSEGAAA